MNKKKILVIGGSGFIGSHVSDILSINGHDVTILDIQKSKWIKKNQKFIEANILDKEKIFNVIKKFDVVYHLASIADIEESKTNPLITIETNILGTSNVIQSCANNSIKKIIFGSTMYAYSNHGSFYKASKLAAEKILEEYAKNYNFEYSIVRFGSLYGPRAQEWNGVKKNIKKLISSKSSFTYKGSGHEIREFIHVLDAAKICANLVNKKYNYNCINITGIKEIKIKDFLELACEISNIKLKIKYKADNKKNSHYHLSPYSYSPSKSQTIVPTEFTDLGQGILELIKEIKN